MILRILYTHSSSLIGGGNKVLLRLLDRLDRNRFEPFSVVPEHGPLESELKDRKIPYLVLDLRPRSCNLLSTATILTRLRWYIIRHGIDILHANDPFTYRLASVATKGSNNCMARICHLHHPEMSSQSIRWSFARQPNLVLTPTKFVRDQVCDWMGVKDTSFVHVVGNPVDVEWFSPPLIVEEVRRRVGIDVVGPHVTIIGALAPHKGHDCFFRMASILLQSIPTVTFHVIGSAQTGDKEWAAQLRQMVHDLNIANSVRFWGFLPDEQVRDVLCASDLFVLPTKVEGFCLAVAEAQACGVPVLTSAIQPLDEVVKDGETGWLLPQGDFQEFARRALELLTMSIKRRSFAAAARRFVMHNFSQAVFAERIMGHYEAISGLLKK